MGEIICSIALGGCLISAAFFYRRYVGMEFEAVKKINREKKG